MALKVAVPGFSIAGTIARITVWTSNQILTAADLNAEFQNMLDTINALDDANIATGAAIQGVKIQPSFTNINQIRWGDNTQTGNKRLTAEIGAGTEPEIRFNVITSRWEIASAGTFFDIATAPEIGSRPVTTAGKIFDVDADTGIDTEQTSDEDIIRFIVTNNMIATMGADGMYFLGANSVFFGTGTTPLVADSIIKAWVVFDGVGAPSIGDSFNVASITDNAGDGDFTIVWTNDFATVNYAVTLSVAHTDNNREFVGFFDSDDRLVGSHRAYLVGAGATIQDWTDVYVLAIGGN